MDMQMLGYTVELKLDSSISLAEKMHKVEAVIQQLNLDGCRDVIIGNGEQRGISGVCCIQHFIANHSLVAPCT